MSKVPGSTSGMTCDQPPDLYFNLMPHLRQKLFLTSVLLSGWYLLTNLLLFASHCPPVHDMHAYILWSPLHPPPPWNSSISAHSPNKPPTPPPSPLHYLPHDAPNTPNAPYSPQQPPTPPYTLLPLKPEAPPSPPSPRGPKIITPCFPSVTRVPCATHCIGGVEHV